MRDRLSHVTDILLKVSGEEDAFDVPPPLIAALYACVCRQDVGQLIRPVNPGDWKESPTVVLLGGFKGLNVTEFLDAFWSQELRAPKQVTLVVTTDDEPSWIYRPAAAL